jgi:hypothetical protein
MENLEFQGKIELINKTATTEWHKWPRVNSLYCALNQEDSIDFSSKADTKNKKINSRTLLAPAHRMNSLCNLSPVTINPNRRLLKCYLLVRSGPFKFVMIKDHTASASTQKKKAKKGTTAKTSFDISRNMFSLRNNIRKSKGKTRSVDAEQ